jgi:hypothetical protein
MVKSKRLLPEDDNAIDESTISHFEKPMVLEKKDFKLVIKGTARLKDSKEIVILGVSEEKR